MRHMGWLRLVLGLAIAGLLAGGRARAFTAAEIADDRALWPKEVSITQQTTVMLYEDGKRLGNRTLEVGETFPVRTVRPKEVALTVDGAYARVNPDDTDLVKRVETGGAGGSGDASSVSPIARMLGGKLVTFSNGRFQPFSTSRLSGVKYYGIYFSAHWCPPCRAFTPKLVAFYNKMKKDHKDFQMIFVSDDRSANDMATYMSEAQMSWPAVAFDKRQLVSGLSKYEGPGIPCLVFIDSAGKVLSNSYSGGFYVGPQKVMAAMEKTLGGSSSWW